MLLWKILSFIHRHVLSLGLTLILSLLAWIFTEPIIGFFGISEIKDAGQIH